MAVTPARAPPNLSPRGATHAPETTLLEDAMKMLALSLALLAAAGPALAEGDAPSPALLAKIQLATQAYQNADSVTKEAKMIRPLRALESAQSTAIDGGNGGVSTKKVGSLDVSKFDHNGDIGQKLQVDINSANSPRTPAAIGQAVGSHASEGNED